MSGNGKFHTRNQWTEEFESHLAASVGVCLLRGILNYGLYLSFPLYVAMMVVGSIHREECPVNKRIPWYLILGGLAGILSVVLRIIMDFAWNCSIKSSDKGVKVVPGSHPALSMVGAVHYLFRLFVIAWNLTATFHIYNVKPTFDDASSLSYCHPSPYYLAFVLVILFDVLIAIVLFIWISALLAGILKPEMIDDLYEDLPDMELETDYNSFRTKQHQRRARRKKDNLKEPSVILEEEKTKSPPSKTLIVPTGTLQTENVPERRSALPIFDAPNFNDWSTDKDIMLAEDKNNLSIVRFATNLDSRRTSKDYWSFEEPLSTPSSTPIAKNEPPTWPSGGAQRLKNLFGPFDGVQSLKSVGEEV